LVAVLLPPIIPAVVLYTGAAVILVISSIHALRQ